jgi:hypothetical protein
LTWNLGTGRRPDGSGTAQERGGDEPFAHFFGQSSFSTVVVVNERTAVRVEPGDDLRLLGPLGCGVQTGAQSIQKFSRRLRARHLPYSGPVRSASARSSQLLTSRAPKWTSKGAADGAQRISPVLLIEAPRVAGLG